MYLRVRGIRRGSPSDLLGYHPANRTQPAPITDKSSAVGVNGRCNSFPFLPLILIRYEHVVHYGKGCRQSRKCQRTLSGATNPNVAPGTRISKYKSPCIMLLIGLSNTCLTRWSACYSSRNQDAVSRSYMFLATIGTTRQRLKRSRGACLSVSAPFPSHRLLCIHYFTSRRARTQTLE